MLVGTPCHSGLYLCAGKLGFHTAVYLVFCWGMELLCASHGARLQAGLFSAEAAREQCLVRCQWQFSKARHVGVQFAGPYFSSLKCLFICRLTWGDDCETESAREECFVWCQWQFHDFERRMVVAVASVATLVVCAWCFFSAR